MAMVMIDWSDALVALGVVAIVTGLALLNLWLAVVVGGVLGVLLGVVLGLRR